MNIPYLLFGKSILKAVKANEMRPPAFSGMEFAFLDNEGNEYYTWPDVGAMPPIRFKEVQAQMAMVDSGTSKSIMEEVSKVIMRRSSEGIQAKTVKAKDEAFADIGMLTKELILRRTAIVPDEAYFALAAVCCARKDEDPLGLDRTIHKQKIEAFMAAGRAGDPFFQRSDCFRLLIGAWLSTAEGFQELRRNWTSNNGKAQAMLQAVK